MGDVATTEHKRVEAGQVPFPGLPDAMDGSAAIVEMETAASEAAGAYPITPSTQMGEGWAKAVADGKLNVNGRRLLFFEPEGEHAAAAVTAGMSLTGLRSANFSAGQGIAYMHESLYAAVGKRLTYVLNVACRAMTKHALNIHAGHDDYHCIDDTGFFQLFAKDVQSAADLNLIAHRVAELSLNPGICAQDGFLTSHAIETLRLPERELIARYLGDPADLIDSPTPAQRIMFGPQRRRIPELFDLDNPTMIGTVQNQDAYAQGVAAQRPFFFDHIQPLTDQAFEEYALLTGRRYARASGYRTDDAEWLVIGQGSIVSNLEAVCDHMRDVRGLALGVVDMTMFRPFPCDLITALLKGRRGVTVLERTDQPLAADAPLLREIRAALGKGLENGRARGALPHPGVASLRPDDVPELYSGCFGLGSRDTQPGDLIASVENMLDGGAGRRQYYLSIDFRRPQSPLPGLKLHQDQVLAAYPDIAGLALERAENVDLMPDDALSVRIHSVGGWGAITMGKNLALTLFGLLGMNVKANPKYGSEKKGMPTTFYATFAHTPIRLNCDLAHVDVALSPDPGVFAHTDALAGLAEDGAFVIQSGEEPAALWASLPSRTQRAIRTRRIRLFILDGFRIAKEEASDEALRYRMQGAAFQGAFFRASPLMAREGLTEEKLFAAIRGQVEDKFGKFGQRVVDDNFRVIRRGFDELREVDWASLGEADAVDRALPLMPHQFGDRAPCASICDAPRFFDQVAATYAFGEEPLAEPFAALSAMPAATGALRDMTSIRQEVPRFLADKCTGCGQCWTQCPDSAIPGLISEVEAVLTVGLDAARDEGRPVEGLRPHVAALARQVRAVLADTTFHRFGETLEEATRRLRAGFNGGAPAGLDDDLAVLQRTLAALPLAKAAPFYDLLERGKPGSGGLLSIAINPATCKACMLCVDVCPDGALVKVAQDDAEVTALRRGWELRERLPDTPDRFVKVSDVEQGIGVLPTLLLKRGVYGSMRGGDGACMGCGEKTVVHLVLSTIEAALAPRVSKFLTKLDRLCERLDGRARLLLAAGADLGAWADGGAAQVQLPVSATNRERLGRLTRLLRDLDDLRQRYRAGRCSVGIANSTGCSSVWASSYPFNPYPYPWVNHLFQDAPSIAIGLFEGVMRKMATAFATVRQAELEVEDRYEARVHGPQFEAFGWEQLDDDEFKLCPPIVTIGGDGAMLDIGFQNLSRLLASGKPIRVIVLDTQVYSNTGGQACTSGFTGQVSDMAEYGKAQRGKSEVRKELALIAIAHRSALVVQSSQAAPSHLMAGVLKAMSSRRPALFCVHSPCMTEHGIDDDAAQTAARGALEGRAFPLVIFDPDAGEALADCMDLGGNPSVDDDWPTYERKYLDDEGVERSLVVPLTTADWAVTEGRFRRHFKPVPRAEWSDAMTPVDEYVRLPVEGRGGKVPFVTTLTPERRLGRLRVAPEVVRLTEERQELWSLLRQMAGIEVAPVVRDRVVAGLEESFDARVQVLERAHDAAVAELKATYPELVVSRLTQALLAAGEGRADGPPPPLTVAARPVVAKSVASSGVAVAAPAPPPVVAAAADDDGDGEAPFIESERCTSCDECIKVNSKLFAYGADKKARVANPRAGTFQQLVLAAERCPAGVIHPGTPLNPKERDLAKWLERARALPGANGR